MRLSYSPAARRDLRTIYKQGARRFGVSQADRYRLGMLQALDFIAQQPFASPEHERYIRPVRYHFYQSHVIFYWVDNEFLRVMRVLHQQQDWRDIL